MKYLFIAQNSAGRAILPMTWMGRAHATHLNNRLRANRDSLRFVEVADLNYLHPKVTGACKDCAAATTNNETGPVFVRDEQAHAFRCMNCGSLNVDLVEPEAK